MKKLLTALFVVMMFFTLAGCTGGDETGKVEKLTLQFVPSKDADVIITATKNLNVLLANALKEQGYDIPADKIDISVGVNYDATGEGMAAGSIDVGWLPGGTYALFSKDVDVILTATRNGLSNDSTNPADWNGVAKKTLKNGPQVTFYRSLIYAAPTEKGNALAAKVNKGEKLTWEELADCKWAVQKTSSSAGYIYPTMWLMDNYNKKLTDLGDNLIALDGGYGEAFAQAASEQVDIIVCYADGRNDYEDAWNLPIDQKDPTGKQGMGRKGEIWDELNVIGVTKGIYNDTVAITRQNKAVYNPEFIKALQEALINVINTDEGKEIFAVYSHTGYAKATDADYDGARQALELVAGK